MTRLVWSVEEYLTLLGATCFFYVLMLVLSTCCFLCPRHKMARTYSVTPFRQSALLSFCHSVIIHFPIIISTSVAHIQLKFDTWMWLMNIEFEFGLMIFDRVMPLELRKNGKFTFLSLSQQPLYVFNSNLIYGCVIKIYKVSLSLNLVLVR